MREDTLRAIRESKLIAVVRGVAREDCLKLAAALYEGGFRLMEIPFDQVDRDSWRETANTVTALREAFEGRMLIGAGTMLTVEMAELAAKAGAQYLVAPNAEREVIARTRELELVSVPGAYTPTEVAAAYRWGGDFIKLFPAGCMGPSYVKALREPLHGIPMLAVGGINTDNLRSFLDVGCCGAAIGSCVANKKWIAAGEFARTTAAARALMAIANGQK